MSLSKNKVYFNISTSTAHSINRQPTRVIRFYPGCSFSFCCTTCLDDSWDNCDFS